MAAEKSAGAKPAETKNPKGEGPLAPATTPATPPKGGWPQKIAEPEKATTAPKPTVGRIVHHRDASPAGWPPPTAAIITHVLADRTHKDGTVVNLTVFGPDGTTRPALNVPYGNATTPHSWWWPPRV